MIKQMNNKLNQEETLALIKISAEVLRSAHMFKNFVEYEEEDISKCFSDLAGMLKAKLELYGTEIKDEED